MVEVISFDYGLSYDQLKGFSVLICTLDVINFKSVCPKSQRITRIKCLSKVCNKRFKFMVDGVMANKLAAKTMCINHIGRRKQQKWFFISLFFQLCIRHLFAVYKDQGSKTSLNCRSIKSILLRKT